jgi:hypothetical protein
MFFTKTFEVVADQCNLLSNNGKQSDISETFLFLEHFEPTIDDVFALARATVLVFVTKYVRFL